MYSCSLLGLIPTAAVFALAGVTMAGDYVLKLASLESRPFRSVWFAVGVLLYAVSAFGWVYAMQHLKLGAIGVIYALATILMLTTLGVLAFGETLNAREIAGMGTAVLAILLLARFAG